MERCDRKKGHGGRHTWEVWNDLQAKIATLTEAEQAAAEAGFGGGFDADCTPAKVIATLSSANNDHEAQIIELEQALGGCRPPLVEGSRVGNMIAYIAKAKSEERAVLMTGQLRSNTDG